jgi:hypothetical protein
MAGRGVAKCRMSQQAPLFFRTFEERNLAQIHNIYPTAYVLRQEKGMPNYGQKPTTAYQLTIEADLNNDLTGKADSLGNVGLHNFNVFVYLKLTQS